MNNFPKTLIDKLNDMNMPPIQPDEIVNPPESLRDELFDKIFPPAKVDGFLQQLPEANSQALVVTNPQGITEWVSPAFTRMCGYSLAELRGRKAGEILQGRDTDPRGVEILRRGIREVQPAQTWMINYHKSGDPYEVEIRLFPIHDSRDVCTGFIAVENEAK